MKKFRELFEPFKMLFRLPRLTSAMPKGTFDACLVGQKRRSYVKLQIAQLTEKDVYMEIVPNPTRANVILDGNKCQ